MSVRLQNARTYGMPQLAYVALAITFYSLSLFACTKNVGNPRQLNLSEVTNYICRDRTFDRRRNECGDRSVWIEADLGVTAYVTVYGASSEEGEEIAKMLTDEKARNMYTFPVVLTVYSTPRSLGREPSRARVFTKNL